MSADQEFRMDLGLLMGGVGRVPICVNPHYARTAFLGFAARPYPLCCSPDCRESARPLSGTVGTCTPATVELCLSIVSPCLREPLSKSAGDWKWLVKGLLPQTMKGVPPMPTIEIDRLSPQERLDLIEKLRTSLEGVDLRVTPAQGAELERRLETLDDDIGQGQEAGDLLAELRRRYP